jgi:iron(III) transport system substrate-binding protein
MQRRTLLKLAGTAAVAEALAIACGGAAVAPSASPTATTAASPTVAASPKPSGTISIYSALNESTNNQLFAAFTAATGVQTAVLPLAAAGELQTRITAEKDSPKADIFVGGSS